MVVKLGPSQKEMKRRLGIQLYLTKYDGFTPVLSALMGERLGIAVESCDYLPRTIFFRPAFNFEAAAYSRWNSFIFYPALPDELDNIRL